MKDGDNFFWVDLAWQDLFVEFRACRPAAVPETRFHIRVLFLPSYELERRCNFKLLLNATLNGIPTLNGHLAQNPAKTLLFLDYAPYIVASVVFLVTRGPSSAISFSHRREEEKSRRFLQEEIASERTHRVKLLCCAFGDLKLGFRFSALSQAKSGRKPQTVGRSQCFPWDVEKLIKIPYKEGARV